MNDMRQGKRFLRGVGMSVLLALVVRAPAVAQEPQEIDVSGTVTSTTGDHLRGVTVRIRGSATSTVTDDNGKYTLTAPADGVLTFSLIGFRGIGQNIGGRTTINVAMERAISVLPEVVVTGYSTQKRTEITGAVTTVDLGSVERQTSARVIHKLNCGVPGGTIDASCTP